MNRNGSSERRLTTAFADLWPTWSPDGKRILFSRADALKQVTEGAGSEIFVMNADGSSKRQLTHNPADDASPAWIPDGRISFVRSANGRERIMVMNADGTGQRPLTRQDPKSISAEYPIWRPNAS